MSQFIGQITIILEASDPTSAESRLRKLGRQIEDIAPEVIFADHNGDVDDYDATETECTESLCGNSATVVLPEYRTEPAVTSTELLATLGDCVRILADYDEQDGDEGDVYRRCLALLGRLSQKPFQITHDSINQPKETTNANS